MAQVISPGEVIRFGTFELNVSMGELRERGVRLSIQGLPLQILAILAGKPGTLVTREELRTRLWPADTFVDFDHSIRNAVARLREALHDSAEHPRYIETLPRRGYRFIAHVASPPSETSTPALQQVAGPGASNKGRTLKLRWLLLAVSVILTAVIGLWVRHRLLYDSPTHRITERRITSNSPGAPVERAVVSPDGKYVAYADPTGLYLRVIASGETRRWDVPKDFIAHPSSWFPDGTHLLVMRMEGMPPTPSLWKLSLLGATPRKLIDNAGLGSVSPDGTRIAFVTFLPYWGSELWVMSADGANPHKIATASQPERPGYSSSRIMPPAWSPDSQRIACIERHWGATLAPLTDLSSLWTRDAEGGDLQVILKDTLLGSALSWGPERRILFASRANIGGERDDEEIHSIRVDERTGKATGEPLLLTNGEGTIGGISETLDGKRLVLWRNNTREQAFISEFDSNTRKWKTPQRLTLDANGNMATAWLSDSRTVLFVSNRNGTWTLFKQAIDETTADVLVEGHSIFLPRLSADGSQVLYLSQTDPAHPLVPISLMRLPVAGGPSQVVLRDIGLGNYQCARLPSTLCIISKSEKDDVIYFSFDPKRGIGRELLKISGQAHDWSLSPDGRTLADFPHDHSIHFLSIENGAAREDKTVTLNEWPVDNGDWNGDGSGLVIPSITPTGTPVILEVNRAGKVSVVLEGAANTPFEFMVQAPDGHRGILGEIVPGDNNAWMIDNF